MNKKALINDPQLRYYRENQNYLSFLNQGTVEDYSLYLDEISNYASKKTSILDVGSGSGLVVNELTKRGFKATGIEVSKPSISFCKKKRKGSFFLYDGFNFPFKANSFNIVASSNVIEHVDDVEKFLTESLRVLRKNGHLVISAPNFLSITSDYHYRTAGLKRKIANIFLTGLRFLSYPFKKSVRFEKFDPIIRPKFQPDDDAVNLINPLDILKWGEIHNLKLIKFEGAILKGYGSYLLRNIPLVNLLTGGVLIVFYRKG